jgi:hypothetical protein
VTATTMIERPSAKARHLPCMATLPMSRIAHPMSMRLLARVSSFHSVMPRLFPGLEALTE